MEPFAHDVDELRRLLAELGAKAFELAYIEYCASLLAEEHATRADATREAA